MGWASGSELFSRVIKALKKELPNKKARERVYEDLISAFEDSDWDTQDECLGEDSAYDSALKALHPNWYEGDDS